MKPYYAVKFLLDTIENNISHELSIEYLAKETGISQKNIR